MCGIPCCGLGVCGEGDVDLLRGEAVVLLKMKMRFVEGVDLRAVAEIGWKRGERERWEIAGVRFVEMRGTRGNMGFV